MENLNYKFFEEFKRLDKLCADMYGTQQGITAYIDDMEATSSHNCRSISEWKSDLQALKILRHKRNYLAHEGSFDEPLCTQADIDWLAAFRNGVMHQTDPIAKMRRESQRYWQQQNQQRRTEETRRIPQMETQRYWQQQNRQCRTEEIRRPPQMKPQHSVFGWLLFLLGTTAAALLFFLIYFLYNAK